MKSRLAVLAIVLAGIAAAALFYLRQEERPVNPSPHSAFPISEPAVSTVKPTRPAPQAAVSPTSSLQVSAAAPVFTARGGGRRSYPLEFTNIPPDRVMDNMRVVFHEYASMFGGNPVGTNPEITAALNGKNPKQVNFINPEAGMRVDGQGELIDPWGTPFFFHQLSGTVMEIHSAGPDRMMWSDDDLVIK